MKTVTDIRSTYLDFFKSKGHAEVSSSPLVPRNDPTLMFAAAGMVQFKNVFTGLEKRPYSRATTAQKCLRAGGKHNDLENVGYTARHHTFFEMMGNFSFGDYFKSDAIPFAWELVTKYFGLPKDKLLVTVYHDDEEAAALWKKVAGFGDDKIIRIKTDDNFWRMGDVGPCGPCSEIFIDQGPALQGGPPGSPDEDGDRFLEFWNLVFMQYEETADGKRLPLPRPSIDTGMGLERMAGILQGVTSNYETDLFRTLIGAAADIAGVDPEGPMKPSYRVIADHLRASVFLLADGVSPGNEGRGYVLRRIMRRAMRHAQKLGVKEPLMHRLVPELVKLMGVAYPEIIRAEVLATQTLKLEETRFRETLVRGLKLLEEETAQLPKGDALPGAVAFKLYDTFGFPADLTADILRGEGRAMDQAGFDAAMQAQKARARAAWSGSGEAADDRIWFELKDELGATEFLGYDAEKAEGIATALLIDGKRAESAKAGDKLMLIANQTPFYGESGGQQGDTGIIHVQNKSGGGEIRIAETQKKLGSVFVHVGEVVKGVVHKGDALTLEVDTARRARIRANHSATHLLHAALRQVLGPHVAQKGSLVAPDRLRFDFSHPKAMTREEIERVEDIVTQQILRNNETATRILTPDQAIAEGAMALFGEKYGEEVRVVSMGLTTDEAAGAKHFSLELCGGTHVRRTGDIGFFKITGESAVSAGVRRIEAVTGHGAREWLRDHLGALTQQLDEVQKAAAAMRKKLERELSDLKQKIAAGVLDGPRLHSGSADNESGIKTIGNFRFIGRVVSGMPARELKPTADAMKKQIGSGIVVVIGTEIDKASVVVGVTDDLTGQISAVDLVRAAAEALGGKGGGGRPDMAQAGGPDAENAVTALAAIETLLAQRQAA